MLFIALFLITIILPIIFWWYFFMWQDRAEPEPKKLLWKIFFAGIGVAFLAGAVEMAIASVVFFAERKDILQIMEEISFRGLSLVVMASIVEELLKFLALREFAYNKRDFNQIADGFFYAVALAIGFIALENLTYFIGLYYEETTGTFMYISLIRAIATALMHITSAGILGYAFGRMKFSPGHSRWIIFKALLLAMALHIAFNLLVSFNQLTFAFIVVFLFFLGLLKVIRKQKAQLVWKLVATDKVNS